jgi:hypothetical protein
MADIGQTASAPTLDPLLENARVRALAAGCWWRSEGRDETNGSDGGGWIYNG